MSQAPSMPFFIDAYLADTGHLSTDEHGAYLLLLMAMWRRDGAVPDDDRDNARVTRMSVAKWRKVRARLLPFLTVADGEITQKRLQKEWNYVKEKREKNAQNGLRGGRPRTREINEIEKANGSVSVSENKTQTKANPVPYPIPVKEKEEKESAAVAASPSKPVVSHETSAQLELPSFLDRRAPVVAEVVELVPQSVRDVEKAFEAYNTVAEFVDKQFGAKWPVASTLSEPRKSAIRARLKDAAGLDGWLLALKRAARSAFLRGKNGRGWVLPGLDWILKPANFIKIMEGAYDDPTGGADGGRDSVAEGFTRAAAAYAD